MNKSKILLLGKLPPPYMGPSIATEILLHSSLTQNFNLIHLDTKINSNIESFGKWGLKKLFKSYALYLKMFKIVYKHKPQLVLIPISQTTKGFVKDSIYILAAACFKRKILIQLRGSDLKNWLSHSSVFTRWYFRRVVKLTSGVIVLGNNLKYLFSDFFSEDSIYVIPNGGNYTFPPKTKKAANEVRILYFSNLLSSKGVEDVFEAINSLKNKNCNRAFSVDFVGDWKNNSTKEKCLAYLKINALPARVHPPAYGQIKFQFFADADIFVFPPREPEGHPWAIVEALAAGLPIISTDKGAIIESVHQNKNGFIVDVSNPEMIAEKLKLLIENPEIRKKMSEESLRIYSQNFTEEKMIEKYTLVFNKVISGT